MKKQIVFLFVILLFAFNNKAKAYTEPVVPDTVKVGVYFISLHDIDFRQKEYTVRFWLWFR